MHFNTRFKDLYFKKISKDLVDTFKYANVHQVPRLVKIVLNMGVGEVVSNSKVIDAAVNDLSLISGQKSCVTLAKKSIASFKLREGMKVGCKVVLRRDKMYDFLERLVFTALPRVREFRGFSKNNFEKAGNLNFGISEQTVFSEIIYDKIDAIRGLNVTCVTSSYTKEEAKALLSGFYLPFNY